MNSRLKQLHPDLRNLVGQTIAERYEIRDLLGIGGMGAVFRAHHHGLKRDVAIKILHPDLTRDSEISARFDREARSASRLEHPNCLRVTDFGSTEHGMKFIVMQLLEGEELSRILVRPLSPLRSVELILQILRGLAHAHAQGVVHRDVKPENVFVTHDHEGQETLKLVDFGIAKIVEGGGDTHKTQAGLVFGTPAYMSPEQAAGTEADARADLYSSGVILYQMLAGRPPFDHVDPVALVRMQVSRDPPPLPAGVPPMLAAVVERLLAKVRDERFQTATDVVETLEAMIPMLCGDASGPVSQPIELPAAVSKPSSADIRAPVTYGMPPATSKPSLWRDWRVLAGGGAALGLVVWFAIPKMAPSLDPAPVAVPEQPVEPDAAPVADVAGPSASALAEIDRLLSANKLSDADKVLGPLRDEFPKNSRLLWRQGRLLAKRRGKQSQALASYGAALDAEPTLLENHDFYAELYELLRHYRVRDEALDLALHQMGTQGHKFLLELVNNTKRPLRYHDRQRALEELRKVESNDALIDKNLNMALDLLQASQSLTPCQAYTAAIEAIANEPDYYFYPRVDKAKVPSARAGNPDDSTACEPLPLRREEVLVQLAALEPVSPDEEAEPDPSGEQGEAKAADKPSKSNSSKSRNSGGTGGDSASKGTAKGTTKRRKRDPDCAKFLGGFRKKCRN